MTGDPDNVSAEGGGAGSPVPRTLALIGGGLAAAAGASIIGADAQMGVDPLANIASVLYVLPTAGFAPLLYVLASLGLGRPLARLLAPGTASPWAAALAFGLAAMLTVTHGLGVLGLLSHRAAAVAPVAVGIALLARSVPAMVVAVRGSGGPSLWWLLVLPAVGVLLAAACSPPGWLWASEFGGYDVLSYHLQLPREWHARGRVWPLDHNVYSYLPGYIEAAFLHTASLLGTPKNGFVTAEGTSLISAQLLHAMLTLAAGLVMAAAGRSLAERTGARSHACLAGFVAGGLTLATPWAVVTGSMAYNEMGVVLLLAGAMLLSFERGPGPVRRGLACGLLVGAACGCKPTALLFGAPVVGLAMLASMPPRAWLPGLLACGGAGLVMLAPWLVRNGLASGNPVFPQLAGVFGNGHWSPEQVARYARAHSFGGSFGDALALLALPDAADPAAGARPVHRGLLHPQWAFAGPLVLVAGGVGLLVTATRRWSAVLLAGIATQVLVWAMLTHVQSRFLLPMLVPLGLVVGLAAAAVSSRPSVRPSVRCGVSVLAGAIVLGTACVSLWIFAGERNRSGGPNALLALGASAFFNPAFADNDPAMMTPEQFMRSQLPDDARVLLIGDAVPLYKPAGTVYATTWDTSPAAIALRAWPSEPEMAALELAETATHVYLDAAELDRLHRTGWSDPVLDPAAVSAWLGEHTRVVRVFPGSPKALFELPKEPPSE